MRFPGGSASLDRTSMIALRIMDLRAEFEAQLRAIAHVEEQLRKTDYSKPEHQRKLAEVVRHEVAQMTGNNINIRHVLSELAVEAVPSDTT